MADSERELEAWVRQANEAALPSAERVARVRATVLTAAGPSSSGSGNGGAGSGGLTPSFGWIVPSSLVVLGGAGIAALAIVLRGSDPSSAVVSKEVQAPREIATPIAPAEHAPPEPVVVAAPAEEPHEPDLREAPAPRRRGIRDENELIAGALVAIQNGELATARRLLDDHERRFSDGLLASEREAARVTLRERETAAQEER